MHKYMRSVGFSQLENRDEIKQLLTDIVQNSSARAYIVQKSAHSSENAIMADYARDFGFNIGVSVCGEFDEEDKFVYEYFYPYLRGTTITTHEDVSVERHAAQESYAGVCDDIRIGVSLIFYLQNMADYLKLKIAGRLPVSGTTLSMSCLSVEGTILFPIVKNDSDRRQNKRTTNVRSRLIAAARDGDEDAIDTLTAEDMDTYTVISKRIQHEDVFSLVDTFFMPYGVECDHYSIMGEILEHRTVQNSRTGEYVHQMSLNCNDLRFDVCINTLDLLGTPEVGRRFKGVVWAQGYINFPTS